MAQLSYDVTRTSGPYEPRRMMTSWQMDREHCFDLFHHLGAAAANKCGRPDVRWRRDDSTGAVWAADKQGPCGRSIKRPGARPSAKNTF